MTAFVLKSATGLIILYGFYYLFLRNIKAFNFNRFYLLFSLLFAVVIPFITIKVSFNLPVNNTFFEFSDVTGNLIQGKTIVSDPIRLITFQDILKISYFIVSITLLIRLVLNIYRIIRIIRISTIVNGLNTQIVLVEPKTLPYSFFKYIFVNRSDFENGKIEKELITHEQIHCQQYHSLDILIIELIKVFLWFNPLIWLFRKTIQLNHEFLADHKVLSNYNLNDYQNTLLNLVFRNNSSYLASNLNYSLTKKRLVMMTKNYTFSKSIYQKIAAINLFLVLTIVFSFSQNIKHKIDLGNYQNEWWYPILKTQNLEIDSFNIFDKVFETGTKHSIKNRVTTIENAIVIVNSTKDDYIIIKSPLAYHDLDKNTIYAEDGYYEIYNIETKKTKASMKLKDYKITSRDNSKITLVARKQVVE